mgnify:FL=1
MAMFKEGCFVRIAQPVVVSMANPTCTRREQYAFLVDRVLRLEHVGPSRSMCSDPRGYSGWFPNVALAAFDVDAFYPFV